MKSAPWKRSSAFWIRSRRPIYATPIQQMRCVQSAGTGVVALTDHTLQWRAKCSERGWKYTRSSDILSDCAFWIIEPEASMVFLGPRWISNSDFVHLASKSRLISASSPWLPKCSVGFAFACLCDTFGNGAEFRKHFRLRFVFPYNFLPLTNPSRSIVPWYSAH